MKYTFGILIFLLTIYSCGTHNKTKTKKPLTETILSVNKDKFKTGESIELTFEVKNNNIESFTFLAWGTPLEGKFTRSCLNIIYNDETIKYSGIMKKRKVPTENDYTTLETNETAKEKVDILKGYKLIEKGVYHIQFKESSKIPASNIITIEIN